MSWNYRVIYHKPKTKVIENVEYEEEEGWYGIHEVYYEEDNITPKMYAIDPDVGTEHKKDLKEILEMMKSALDKPVLDQDELDKQVSGDSDA